MAQALEPPRSSLLALVDELLLEIVDFVESKDDLCSLARVCSRLQGLTEPALYRSILIHKGSTALRILSAILIRPARVLFIRQLQVRYMYAHRHGISVLNEILRQMRNLQELTIESPCCNDTYAFVDEDFETKGLIDYADYFIFASSMTLGSQPRVQVPLQSFTLHSHGEPGARREAFNMGRNSIIFLHPTLRHLTVSCFDVNEDVVLYLSGHRNTTRLQSLIFDECNITAAGLTAILAVPKALQELTIGERMYHLSRDGHVPLGRFPGPFLEALALQKDSLQYLKHVGGFCNFDDLQGSSADLSLDIFPNLRELELGHISILTLFMNSPSRSTSLPNLYLRIIQPFRSEPDAELVEHALLPTTLHFIRKCPHLDVIIDCAIGRTGMSLADSLQLEKFGIWKRIVAHLQSDASETQKSSINRRLRILVSRRDGLIPPYMYGEKVPVEEVVFDSDSPDARKFILT